MTISTSSVSPGSTALVSLQNLTDVILDGMSAAIKDQTLASVVELCALRAYSVLEEFLQRLFYVAMLDIEHSLGAVPKFQVSDHEELELLLFNTGNRREKYLDWLPYEVSLGRAEAYLSGGVPFSRLKYRPVELRALAELAIIRNAVAHPSDYAAQRFKDLAAQRSYLSDSPAHYLLSIRSGEREILHVLARLAVLVAGLTAGSDAEANGLLEPERPFEPDKRAPQGRFTCNGCDSVQVLTGDSAVLVACSNCLIASRCESCKRTKRTSPTWTRMFE